MMRWFLAALFSVLAGASLAQPSAGGGPGPIPAPVTWTTSVIAKGADPTGVADSTAAFNAAIATGQVFIPCGTYKIVSPLTPITADFVTIVGESRSCVNIQVWFASGDLFSFGSATVAAYMTSISGVRITSMANQTAGAMLHLVNTSYFTARDFYIGTTLIASGFQPFDCLVIDAHTVEEYSTTIDTFTMSGCSDKAIWIGSLGEPQGIVISKGDISWSNYALYISFGAGIQITDVDIIQTHFAGVTVSPSAASSQSVWYLFMTRVFSDSSFTGSGWDFIGDGKISNVSISQSWSASNPLNGVTVTNAAINTLDFQAMTIEANGQYGMVMGAGKNWTIGGGTKVCNNGTAGSNSYDGIWVGSGVSNWLIEGVTSGNCGGLQNLGIPNLQHNGISVAGGTSENFNISNNNLSGNMTAGLSEFSNAAFNRTVVNNIGVTNDGTTLFATSAANGGTTAFAQINVRTVLGNAGLIATHTVLLPAISGVIGQSAAISSYGGVTALTVQTAASAAITGSPTTLPAGTQVSLISDGAIWHRNQ